MQNTMYSVHRTLQKLQQKSMFRVTNLTSVRLLSLLWLKIQKFFLFYRDYCVEICSMQDKEASKRIIITKLQPSDYQ